MLERHRIAIFVIGGLLQSPSILAQSVNEPNQAASAGPYEVQEIIVTARKREESILDVPVVETAVPAQQLERTQTLDLKDVANLVSANREKITDCRTAAAKEKKEQRCAITVPAP